MAAGNKSRCFSRYVIMSADIITAPNVVSAHRRCEASLSYEPREYEIIAERG